MPAANLRRRTMASKPPLNRDIARRLRRDQTETRTPAVVSLAQLSTRGIQVPEAVSDRSLFRGFLLPGGRACCRARRLAAPESIGRRRKPNRVSTKRWIHGAEVLESSGNFRNRRGYATESRMLFQRAVERNDEDCKRCGAPDNRAAQMSLTLTLSRRTGEGIRGSISAVARKTGPEGGPVVPNSLRA